jgi:lysophospholipase L1-like esterase
LLQKPFADYYQEYDRSIITFDKKKAHYDSRLFYMLKPDTTLAFDNVEFKTTVHTNAKGLRDDNASLVKPQIICLGDSYTFGWGVDDKVSFPDQLEKQSGYKVLNAGVSSFGTARELALLNQLDTSNLKYLIIQYCDNDAPENNAFVKNNYRLEISPESTYNLNVSQLDDLQKYFPGKVFLLTAGDFFTQPYQFTKTVIKSKLRKKGVEARTFLEILRHSNINFNKVKVIVTYLVPFDTLTDPFIQEVETIRHEEPYNRFFGHNLQILDLSNCLLRQDYFTLDIHLNAFGQETVANALAQTIKKEDLK